MSLSISSIRCFAQVALLGAITDNIRAVLVLNEGQNIDVIFVYQRKPSEQEEDLAETVSGELLADFPNCSVNVEKTVLPYPEKIPQKGIRVFHRYEV